MAYLEDVVHGVPLTYVKQHHVWQHDRPAGQRLQESLLLLWKPGNGLFSQWAYPLAVPSRKAKARQTSP